MATKAVFIDTSSLYNFERVDHVRWREAVFPKTERIVVVLSRVNFRELNDHKDSGRKPHLKERAAGLLRQLDAIFDSCGSADTAAIRDGEDLHFFPRSGELQPGLSAHNADDQLIADILAYRELHPEQEVVLITSDTGMKSAARSFGIDFARLPDKYRRQEPEDPHAKQVKVLEGRIKALEVSRPAPKIVFAGGSETITLEVPADLTIDDIPAVMQQIRDRSPLLHIALPRTAVPAQPPRTEAVAGNTRSFTLEDILALPDLPPDPNDPDAEAERRYGAFKIGMLSDAGRKTFNAALQNYYAACEEYLRQNLRRENGRRRTYTVALEIRNDGGAPATDLDIFLRFPVGMTAGAVPKPSKTEMHATDAPQPPDPEDFGNAAYMKNLMALSHIGAGNSALEELSNIALRPTGLPPPPPNVSRPRVCNPSAQDARTNGVQLRINVIRLKHKMTADVDALKITLPTDNVGCLEVEYRIIAQELPDEIFGRLTIERIRGDSNP